MSSFGPLLLSPLVELFEDVEVDAESSPLPLLDELLLPVLLDPMGAVVTPGPVEKPDALPPSPQASGAPRSRAAAARRRMKDKLAELPMVVSSPTRTRYSCAMTEPDLSFVTAEGLMDAAGVTKRTVLYWVEAGLLPQPWKGPPGQSNSVWFYRWPASALEQARFVSAKRREGLTHAAIRELLAPRNR